MPDKRVTELAAIDTVADTDLVMVIDDPAGTAINKKATVDQLRTALGAHHATHEPGGNDALVNAAWTDLENTFTIGQHIEGRIGNAALYLSTPLVSAEKLWALTVDAENDENALQLMWASVRNARCRGPDSNGENGLVYSANDGTFYPALDGGRAGPRPRLRMGFRDRADWLQRDDGRWVSQPGALARNEPTTISTVTVTTRTSSSPPYQAVPCHRRAERRDPLRNKRDGTQDVALVGAVFRLMVDNRRPQTRPMLATPLSPGPRRGGRVDPAQRRQPHQQHSPDRAPACGADRRAPSDTRAKRSDRTATHPGQGVNRIPC